MLEKLHIAPECDGFLFLAESARNPPVLHPHRHVELELNVVKQGTIRYVVEDRTYTFPRGTVLWLFPEQMHQLVDRTPDAAYFVAVFRPRMIRHCCRTRPYATLRKAVPPKAGVLHHVLPEDALLDLVRMLEELTRRGQDPDLLNREAGFGLTPGFEYRHGDPDGLNAGLRHLLLSAWRQYRGDMETDRRLPLHPAVRQTLDLLNHAEQLPDLEHLAAACGVSPSTLSRLFRREMDLPLSGYRNSIRMSRFMRAWGRPGRSTMLECMHEAGFGSYPQFYRVFKGVYGDSPRNVLGAYK